MIIRFLFQFLFWTVLITVFSPIWILFVLIYAKGIGQGLRIWWPEGFWIQVIILAFVLRWLHNDFNCE